MRSVVFACAVDDDAVYERHFGRSPDVLSRVLSKNEERAQEVEILRGATSAAAVNDLLIALADIFHERAKFYRGVRGADVTPPIVVYAHQDVFLPAGWLDNFKRQWELACALDSDRPLAVAGCFGVWTPSPDPRVASVDVGHLLDRGRLLRPAAGLPHPVHSLDECLVAIDPAARIFLDPRLGWHLWATDLCLQAEERGLSAAALDVYLEHWSTQSRYRLPPEYAASQRAFQEKWRQRLPVVTCNGRILP